MRRFTRLTAIAATLLLLVPLLAAAQETPSPEGVQPEITPEATEAISIVNDATSVLISARSDLELLANSQLGSERPVGWSGSLDISDPQLPLYIRLDLELLAATLLGMEQRPDGWFGAMGGSPFSIARDIRHDLELLADTVIEPGVRPPGWASDDPLMRCDRAVQSLVTLLERSGIILQADPNSTTYCAQAEIEASQLVDQNFSAVTVAGGAAPQADGSPAASGPTGTLRETLTGVAVFFDRNATDRAGVMPRGTSFTAVARSSRQFSNMMVATGDGFQVFVDYTYTTLSVSVFESLPDIDSMTLDMFCAVDWCD